MWTEYRQVGQDNLNFNWYSEVQRRLNGTPIRYFISRCR